MHVLGRDPVPAYLAAGVFPSPSDGELLACPDAASGTSGLDGYSLQL